MSEQTIIEQCAPTLAGIKTGSLFPYEFSSREEERKEIRMLNKILCKKGLRVIPIEKQNGRTLIYIYRPSLLRRDLSDPLAADILKEKGYHPDKADLCIVKLIKHLLTDTGFPHEIGLFLGYPPADVRGFMNSPKEGVQCVGYWKVYGNKDLAEKKFQRYRKCTEVFRKQYQDGVPLIQMTVAV